MKKEKQDTNHHSYNHTDNNTELTLFNYGDIVYDLETDTEKNIPTYCVLQNKTLELIAENLPNNIESLEKIKGVGNTILQKYGTDLIDIISRKVKEILYVFSDLISY